MLNQQKLTSDNWHKICYSPYHKEMIKMNNKNLSQQKSQNWSPNSKLLPFMFDTEPELLKLEEEEKTRVEQFEKKLAGELKSTDTIEEAINKMVKAALGVEFGEKLMKEKAAYDMINTITHGILADPQLRRQALIIVDRYTGVNQPKEIIREKSNKTKVSTPEVKLY